MLKFSEYQNGLYETLVELGVAQSRIEDLLNSGYFCISNKDGIIQICDRYYDISVALGIEGAKQNITPQQELRSFTVHSLADACAVVEKQLAHINPSLKDRIVFRGENTVHFLKKRAFPNPLVCAKDGLELSLIPSYWRQYSSNNYSTAEEMHDYLGKRPSIDSIIYTGIYLEDVIPIIKRYEVHSMSDFEQIDDPLAQEIYHRYSLNKVYRNDDILLSQHYGIKTPCLDVTFDLKTALFFSLYKFTKLDNGKATYVKNSNKNAMVFCLLFTDPCLSTQNMITEIGMFDHIPPIRPLIQKCALVDHDFLSINKSAAHIIFALELSPGFEFTGIPLPQDLFPCESEDKFYKYVLEMKRNYPEFWGDIIEYDFG